MQYIENFYVSALDAWVARYAGKVLRLYDSAQNGLNLPTGVLLSEFTIPSPSHVATAFNATNNRFEAAKTGTWSDLEANASGNPLSFVIGTLDAGGVYTVEASGSAGGPAAVDPDMRLSDDYLYIGARFTVTEFLQFMNRA